MKIEDLKTLSEGEKRVALKYLMRSLQEEFQPTSWEELHKLWHDDLKYRKSFMEWLSEYWTIPTRKTIVNEKTT